MNLALILRLVRVGFLPILLLSNASMLVGTQALYPTRPLAWPMLVLLCANIGLMLFGSLLNDVCDAKTDAANPTARKVLVERRADRRQQWALVGAGLALPLGLDAGVFVWLAQRDGLMAMNLFLPVSLLGYFLATAYSLPPIRARARLFGATWTLMTFHVICFIRVIAVSVTWADLLPLHPALPIVCGFLWACHGITTVAMKDVPDAFADATEGIRSIPNVWGAVAATVATGLFLLLTVAAALAGVVAGFLHPRFLLLLVPLLAFYLGLALYLHHWLVRARASELPATRTPRTLFHALAYLGTWGMLIPAFMCHLR